MPPKKQQPKKEVKKELFNTKVIRQRDHIDSQETVLQLYKDDNKTFTLNEVKNTIKSLADRVKTSGRDMRYMVKVVAPDGIKHWTIKNFYSGEINIKEEEDYYEGKVKDPVKFMNNFSQIQLIVQETYKPTKQQIFKKQK